MDTKDRGFFDKAVAETVSEVREGLTNMGWKPCIDENGMSDNTHKKVTTDWIGKTVVVLRLGISKWVKTNPKPDEWDKRLVGELVIVKIVSVTLANFDHHDGKLRYLQYPQFDLEGKTNTVYQARIGNRNVDLLGKWHLVAFERTNAKLPDSLHIRGRASAPAPSQNYANTSTPHNTKVGALSCLNI